MKKRTRLLSILLAAAMITVSGCGNASTGEKTAERTTAETEKGEPEEQTAAKADNGTEKPTLKYLGRDATFDLAASPVAKMLEEKTGYHMEYEALPQGDEGTTKLMMLIASSAEYDIINGYPYFFDQVLTTNAIMPLDDLLKNAPNLMKAVPPESESWKRVTGEDGKIYGIPQLLPIDRPVSTIMVRQDILDELGLAMPQTPDELYTVLRAIKAAKPDMIPLTMEKMNAAAPISLLPPTNPIQSGFGAYRDWYEKDGKLVYAPQTEEYKEYITFMNKLYAEGLLDAEFPANDLTARLSKFTAGKAAMTTFSQSDGPGFYSALETNIPDAEIVCMPFLKDKNGNMGVMSNGGLEKIAFIPKTSKNPEAAIAWVDAFMANFKEIYVGSEGVQHEVKDGKYYPIMPAFADHDTVWWYLPAVDEANAFDYWQARSRKNPEVERAYSETFAMRTDDVDTVIPYFEMFRPNEEMLKLETQLRTLWGDEMIKMIAGSTPISDYDKILANWESQGGTRFVELANQVNNESK